MFLYMEKDEPTNIINANFKGCWKMQPIAYGIKLIWVSLLSRSDVGTIEL